MNLYYVYTSRVCLATVISTAFVFANFKQSNNLSQLTYKSCQGKKNVLLTNKKDKVIEYSRFQVHYFYTSFLPFICKIQSLNLLRNGKYFRVFLNLVNIFISCNVGCVSNFSLFLLPLQKAIQFHLLFITLAYHTSVSPKNLPKVIRLCKQ